MKSETSFDEDTQGLMRYSKPRSLNAFLIAVLIYFCLEHNN